MTPTPRSRTARSGSSAATSPNTPWATGSTTAPSGTRKLLLHRREIAKFAGKATQRGFTLVPLRMYFKDGRAKVELAVARGKKEYDKRQDQKKEEAKREIRKAMSKRIR